MRFNEYKEGLKFCKGCELWYDEETIYCSECLKEMRSLF